MKDDFGDRMKEYEAQETQRRFMRRLPICARIDGRSFSTYTRGMEKPFDTFFAESMIHTTQFLVKETNALIGYTQSDEITLIYHTERLDGQGILFDGKIHKMTSVLAGMASAKFAVCMQTGKLMYTPHFDCRVWQVPDKHEAANVLLWRAQDARRNAVTRVCSMHYSAKQMHGKSQAQMLDMIDWVGDSLENYPRNYLYGTYVRPTLIYRTPEAMRREAVPIDMPFFGEVDNRVDVVFNGAPPILKEY